MQLVKQSESTAARRFFYLHLVDASDGLTPETGEAGGQPQISKNGAGFGNTSATLTAIGNGAYYVALTADELDTLGVIMVRYKSANTAEFQDIAYVVAYDPYSSVLGLTDIAAIKAKTDNLPSDPASESGALAKDATVAKEFTVLTLPATVDTQLSGSHGAGSWEGGTPPTPAEIEAYLAGIHGAGSWQKGAEYPV